MKIAVNARMLTQWKPGGIKRYARETLLRITDRHREHQFLFLVDRPFPERVLYPDNVTVVRTFPSFHPLLWYPWFEAAVPWILKKHAADLFLSVDGYACLSTQIPTVTVLHDLNFHHYPEDLPLLVSQYDRYFFPKFARKAKIIATVSEFTKQDIVNLYGESPDKILVTGCGVNAVFHPLAEEERITVRQKITGGAPYLLSVGALHPRKNLVRLLAAFEKFRRETPSSIRLVLVGPRLFKTGDVFAAWQRNLYKEDILFLDRVSDGEIVRIYGGASALLFVSYFEGFGIPALEAMNCDIPVVAADRTSLPEVCGKAACLVDPFSVDSIAGAMKEVCFNETLRKQLIENGREQRKLFDWDKTADLLWQAVERSQA